MTRLGKIDIYFSDSEGWSGEEITNANAIEKFRKLLGRESKGKDATESIYVTGSGLVPVPELRLAEIPRVIEEHHNQERELSLMLLRSRRVV